MNIFIKESLYLLDYNDNILDVLFLSTDKDTPGQAYEINIKENNTGYSDLTFKMPSFIVNEEGEKVVNPKLTLIEGKRISAGKQKNNGLVPLAKVRYNRVVRYMGEEFIDFPGPNGTTIRYPKNDGENPEDYIIEDYVMDYVIQPLDKARQSLKIDLTYTAIDFPRFNLSKKKLGLTIDQNTLTTSELSIWGNTPTSVPGSVHYIPWTEELAQQFQSSNAVSSLEALKGVKRPTKGEVYYVSETADRGYYQFNGEGWDKKTTADFVTWEPNPQSGGYPLDDASIIKLVSQTHFTDGILATVYYWPVKMPVYTTESGDIKERKTARFEGVTYERNSFITLSLYNLYDGLELKYKTNQRIGNIAWDWNYLEPNQLYLNPNNACNLLRYILKNTNWSVANDGGAYFIPKTGGTYPWFEPGEAPATGEEGQYYIIRNEEPDGSIHPYTYTIIQCQNGHFTDATKELLPIVNTDENDLEHFGIKYDVFVEPKEVSRTAEGTLGQTETMNAQYSLSVSNANCYNAITSEAKLFNLYPVFDCINKTVALKKHAGADYGLTYRAGRNLKTSNIKLDGEKVITKMYVTGGTDAQGSANINIGEAVRVIQGVTPYLTSPNLNGYAAGDQDIADSMRAIQNKAYSLINGTKIASNLDLSDKELVLNFPDNFYTYFFPIDPSTGLIDEASTMNSFGPIKLMGTDKDSVWLRYQGADNTHCFYIYVAQDDVDYLNEKNQLYKADLTNIKIRRNLSSFRGNNFGTVNKIPGSETIGPTQYTTDYSNYIKYRETIEDGQEITPSSHNYMYKEGIGYMGYNLTIDTDGYYKVDEPFNTVESFVLAGPTRVYKFDASNALTQVNTQNFIPGNYYYTEENGSKRFYYCALQNSFQDISSNLPYYNNDPIMKMNSISIGNYVFLYLGDGSDAVVISNNGSNYTIQDLNGNQITYNDWLINNYALRVQADEDNHILYETYVGDEWDPNAEEYLVGRSPYGTSYIYNFKYLYDNEWITREQILDIYAKSYEINAINIEFFNKYNKALEAARAAYWNAINNLELYESKGDAQLETLMSQYWKDPAKASDNKFSAFPAMPKGNIAENRDKHMYTTDIHYEGETVKTIYFNVFGTNMCNYLYPNSDTFPASASNPETEGQYHVVAKALGWDQYYRLQLPIDSSFVKQENVIDASDTVSNYNKIIDNMKLYYWKAKQANETMDEALTEVEQLEKLFDEWQESLNVIERDLQENYGQYIIEGSYNNNEQPYANLLLDDGLKASDLYAIPDVTYGVNVVDASGMIEYRAPQNLVCNDLVKKLHSLGQIVPKVGDYVAIFDDDMGLIKVAGLITAITRRIDDPYQNALTIDTSYTDADELVGQIITATNTVLNNKDIYGRANIISSKGELQTSTVTDALSTGKNSLSITSTNGKIVVDDNGLTATNPEDDQKLMRYNGTGVLGSNNGGITWRNLMTQDGINANYIEAGTINTQRVSISDGQYNMVYLDGNGLVVKEGNKDGDPNDPSNINEIGGVKNYDIGYIDSTTLDPIGFHNVSVYVGKDSKGEGIGYFSGYINANKGGNIGGWRLSSTGLWKGGVATSPIYYLGSSGLTIPETDVNNRVYNVRGPFTLKVGTQFGVLDNGNVYIGGDVHIKGSANSNIGNWTVTSSAFYNGKSSLTDNSEGVYIGTDGIALGKTKDDNNKDLIRFKVTKAGVLTAKSGTIGGWTIGDKSLHTSKNDYYLGIEGITATIGKTERNNLIFKAGSNFGVQSDGSLFATDGVIGGWNISSTELSRGKMTLSKDGFVWSKDSTHFFAAGDGTNHPVTSALNAREGFYIYSDASTSSATKYVGGLDNDGGNIHIKSNNDTIVTGDTVQLRCTGADEKTGLQIKSGVVRIYSVIQVTGDKPGLSTGSFWVDGSNGHGGGDYELEFVNGICVKCTHHE